MTSNVKQSDMLDNFDLYYDRAIELIKQRSINIDTTHRCLLQCPFCARQNYDHGKAFVKQSQQMYGDIKLDHVRDLGNTWIHMSFCGQISDPIFHSNFISVIKTLGETTCEKIDIHTTASGKKIEWWQQLVDITNNIPQSMRWVFGIDGIDEKSALHRINQNTSQALDAMKYVAQNTNDEVVWQYIPFGYNEDDIPAAIDIANQYNIKLMILKSGRFHEEGNILEPPKDKNLYNVYDFAKREYIN